MSHNVNPSIWVENLASGVAHRLRGHFATGERSTWCGLDLWKDTDSDDSHPRTFTQEVPAAIFREIVDDSPALAKPCKRCSR